MATILGYGLSCFDQFKLIQLHSSATSIPPVTIGTSSDDPFSTCSHDLVHINTSVQSLTIQSTWDSTFIRIELNNQTVISFASNKLATKLKQVNDDVINVWEANNGLLVKTCGNPPLRLLSDTATELINADISHFCTLTNGKSYALLTNGTLCGCSDIHSFKHDVIFSKPVIKHVANGSDHILLLTDTGCLYSFGIGSRGQLGHGDLISKEHPTMIEPLAGIMITSISCGYWHSMALSEHGDIYSWGMNDKGQLGHSPDTTICPLPTVVIVAADNANFTAISCGSQHSAGCTNDSILYTWGWGGHGQVVESSVAGVKYVSCGPWSTLCMRDLSTNP